MKNAYAHPGDSSSPPCPPPARPSSLVAILGVRLCLLALACVLCPKVHAQETVPGLTVESGVEVSWPSVGATNYQLQVRQPTYWQNLGAPVAGNDTVKTVFRTDFTAANEFRLLLNGGPGALTPSLRSAARLRWTAPAGSSYVVQTSFDSVHWTDLSDPIAGTGTVYTYMADMTATSQTYRLNPPGASDSLDDLFAGFTGGEPVMSYKIPLPKATLTLSSRVSWPTVSGRTYQFQSSLSGSSIWADVGPPIAGTGSVAEVFTPNRNTTHSYRVKVTEGSTVLPTMSSSALTFVKAGKLTWLSIPGQTYQVQTYAGNFMGDAGFLGLNQEAWNTKVANIVGDGSVKSAVVDMVETVTYADGPKVNNASVRLWVPTAYSPAYPRMSPENEPSESDPNRTYIYVTRFTDRVRDRHARNNDPYDQFLSFYWEQRTTNIRITEYPYSYHQDGVTYRGASHDMITNVKLGSSNIRFSIYRTGGKDEASYALNFNSRLVQILPSTREGKISPVDYRYTIEQGHKANVDGTWSRISLGDRFEVEFSPFALNTDQPDGILHARSNYYGTAFLYVSGRGIVPWYQSDEFLAPPPAGSPTGIGYGTLESFPLPTKAWLGGRMTLPYQYSQRRDADGQIGVAETTEPQQRFKQPAPNMSFTNGQRFMLGRRIHQTNFITGAHSEPGNPIFNEYVGKLGNNYKAKSCVECHVNNGGSLLPAIGSPLLTSVVNVGGDAQGTTPHPVLGETIQPQAQTGLPEARVIFAGFQEAPNKYGAYPENTDPSTHTDYTLGTPRYTFEQTPAPAYFSVRVAPRLVGLGLLEALPEEAILARADPLDVDGDGISGRIQMVDDPEEPGKLRLGRFGYKATQAKVIHQIAYALNRDMGVTSAIFPLLDGQSTAGPIGIPRSELDLLDSYISLLAVPPQRNLNSPDVIRGEQVFTELSCIKCHVGDAMKTVANHPRDELRDQTIRPFTDLLLHDLGPDLAATLGEEEASGAEWRTAPLWGIGLSETTRGGGGYLHDGRARTLEEAILWHGGEAQTSRNNFKNSPRADRDALIAFLKSL